MGRSLALTALLVALCPVVVTVLPESLLYGLRRASPGRLSWEYVALLAPFAAGVWWLDGRGRRLTAFAVVAALAGGGLWFVKRSAAPVLDELVSARGLWRRVEPRAGETCVESLHRNWRYGLNYYAWRAPLPDCGQQPRPLAIVQEPGGMPRVEPRGMKR